MAMMVRMKEGEELPDGSVRITENIALKYQMSIIENWPKFSEVFAWKSSTFILGGMATASSFLINNHFRFKLKLGKYGRLSSYLTVVATPVLISTLFNKVFIQSKIVLRTYDCPLCLQTNAGIVQGGMAVGYPFLLAPVASFMFATRHFTYRLPSLTTETKDVVKLWLKFTRSGATMGLVLLGVNMVVAIMLTARQMQEHANISMALAEFERKVESGSLGDSDL